MRATPTTTDQAHALPDPASLREPDVRERAKAGSLAVQIAAVKKSLERYKLDPNVDPNAPGDETGESEIQVVPIKEAERTGSSLGAIMPEAATLREGQMRHAISDAVPELR